MSATFNNLSTFNLGNVNDNGARQSDKQTPRYFSSTKQSKLSFGLVTNVTLANLNIKTLFSKSKEKKTKTKLKVK